MGSGDREDHNVNVMAAADHECPVQTVDGAVRVVARVADAPLVASLWSRHTELTNWMWTANGQVACWQGILIMAPIGSTGKRFMNIIANFINALASDGPTDCFAGDFVAIVSTGRWQDLVSRGYLPGRTFGHGIVCTSH